MGMKMSKETLFGVAVWLLLFSLGMIWLACWLLTIVPEWAAVPVKFTTLGLGFASLAVALLAVGDLDSVPWAKDLEEKEKDTFYQELSDERLKEVIRLEEENGRVHDALDAAIQGTKKATARSDAFQKAYEETSARNGVYLRGRAKTASRLRKLREDAACWKICARPPMPGPKKAAHPCLDGCRQTRGGWNRGALCDDCGYTRPEKYPRGEHPGFSRENSSTHVWVPEKRWIKCQTEPNDAWMAGYSGVRVNRDGKWWASNWFKSPDYIPMDIWETHVQPQLEARKA